MILLIQLILFLNLLNSINAHLSFKPFLHNSHCNNLIPRRGKRLLENRSLSTAKKSSRDMAKPKLLIEKIKEAVTTPTTATTKAKAKGSGSKSINLLNLQYDFSIASFISGIFFATSVYYYLESEKFETKFLRNQLISDEINLDNIEKSKVLKDPKLFKEAFIKGNERLCLALLEQKRGELNELIFDTILIEAIYKNMPRLVNSLLPHCRQQIDVLNEETGDNPLLAAIKAKMFPQARELLKMGAKPFIPATLKYKSRGIEDFLKEIVDVTVESEDLKRDLLRLYGNKI